MPSKAHITFKDFDNETSSFQVNGVALTSANFDAQNTLWGNLLTAIDGITLGNPQSYFIGLETGGSTLPATSPVARREVKWLVTFTDDVTGKQYRREIPCPDLTNAALFSSGDKEKADLLQANVAAFVTAFEAFVTVTDAENAVTIQEIRMVGRNL